MKNKVYCLSGLANDHRAFKYIDFGDNDVVHIPWIVPKKQETIEAHAKRLCEFITTPNPILIGLSFGGIMASEIAKHIVVKKIILLSSVKTYKELPFYMRWFGKAGLQKIISPAWVLQTNFFVFWVIRLRKKEHKALLTKLFNATDHWVYKWSADVLLNWKNTTVHPNIYHIHGNGDTVLPHIFTTPDCFIKGGGHFCVVTHGEEVSKILLEQISNS
jgi:pimeloyl-ACP methyl ester carboxylesterase